MTQKYPEPAQEQFDGINCAAIAGHTIGAPFRFIDSGVFAWTDATIYARLLIGSTPTQPGTPDPSFDCQDRVMFVEAENRAMAVCAEPREMVVECGAC